DETLQRVQLEAAGEVAFMSFERVLAESVGIAQTILHVGRVLQRLADLVAARLCIPAETVAHFGPLGLGLQVQGAIAAHLARRVRLGLEPEERAALLRACDGAVEDRLREFCQERAAGACLECVKGQIKFDANGFPHMDADKLCGWLAAELASMR